MNLSQSNRSVPAAARSLDERVWNHIENNEVREAIDNCERLNKDYPGFAPGWNTASHIAMRANKPLLALAAIEKALALDPENTAWLLQEATCLSRLGQLEQLAEKVALLKKRKLKTVYQLSALGMLLTQLEQRAEAVKYYERAAAMQPNEAKHYYNIACLQRSLGDLEAAESNFDKTIELNTTDYEAFKLRSDLRSQTPENNHVDSLAAMLEKGIDDPRGAVQVCFALAKELEDLGESERSFHYLKMGADARRSLMKYDVSRDVSTMSVIRDTFGPNLFDGSIPGHDSPEPIFVLGLPRTGTTLVERILSSHSDVYAAGELNNFSLLMSQQAKQLAGDKKLTRDEMVQLSANLNFQDLGAAYIESTRPLTGSTARFIDKLPLNYLYVGLIHLALPNAKIIVLNRDSLDTCYAIYKQLFTNAYPFSYRLDELAEYYVAYHRLMEHWQTVLPGKIHKIDYESLVNDIDGESRKLVEFCNLEWQEQCLKYYENKEASTTASTVQVRQPVYQSSVGKWRRVREQMQPVVDIIQRAGIEFDNDK
jgi:tetratricopeptide (TPR) repeat protein